MSLWHNVRSHTINYTYIKYLRGLSHFCERFHTLQRTWPKLLTEKGQFMKHLIQSLKKSETSSKLKGKTLQKLLNIKCLNKSIMAPYISDALTENVRLHAIKPTTVRYLTRIRRQRSHAINHPTYVMVPNKHISDCFQTNTSKCECKWGHNSL